MADPETASLPGGRPARPVTLRNVILGDLPVFYAQQLNPEAVQMAAFPSRDEPAFMAHWKKVMADENVMVQTILYGERVAGNIVSFVVDGKREVGYWLGKEFWGQGIATDALRQLLTLTPHRPLYAEVARHNRGSQRVLEKCGFEKVGAHGEIPDMGEHSSDVYLYRLE